jgi:DNA-binding NarL/FixJ family response regulator
MISLRQARIDQASPLLEEALTLAWDVSEARQLADALLGASSLAAARGDPACAAVLGGAATALQRKIGIRVSPSSRQLVQQTHEVLATGLEPGVLQELLAKGEAMPLADIVDMAHAAVRQTSPALRAMPPPDAGLMLTPRERDVLRLLSSGLTNPEIAATLFIGVRTVQTHVGNIFAKLGVNSRAEASSVAARRGLI